jgi:hypothetical protein
MEKIKMEKIQVETIKKLLMLSSKNELVKVRSFISEAISRECDLDDEDQEAFEQWKAGRAETDEKNN